MTCISRKEFRGILFEVLRSGHWAQFNDLVSKVASIKGQRLSLAANPYRAVHNRIASVLPTDLNKAAAIMLGAASEQAILLLIDAWIGSTTDAQRKSAISVQNAKATSIFKKFELFQRHLHNHKGQLPSPLSEDVENNLSGHTREQFLGSDITTRVGRYVEELKALMIAPHFVKETQRWDDELRSCEALIRRWHKNR